MGTSYHMVGSCYLLFDYWQQVTTRLAKALKIPLTLDPLDLLLGIYTSQLYLPTFELENEGGRDLWEVETCSEPSVPWQVAVGVTKLYSGRGLGAMVKKKQASLYH